MTEILVDVDIRHPPERVWRALTDRAVLSVWFMRTDLEPYQGSHFRLMPDGLLGLGGPVDGELVEVVEPRRLVMLWRGEQLHSRVTWELVPLPDGCRLRLSHTGFIGVRGSLRRKELHRAYDGMLNERLPRVLDDLAAGRTPTAGAAGSAAGPPEVAGVAGAAGDVAGSAGAAGVAAGSAGAAGVAAGSAGAAGVAAGSAGRAAGSAGRAAGSGGVASPAGVVDGGPDRDRDPVPVLGRDRDPVPGPVRDAGRDPRRGRRAAMLVGWLHRLPHRRRGQLLAVLATALLAVLTMAVISSLGVPGFTPPFGAAPEEPPVRAPTTVGASPAGAPASVLGNPQASARPGETVKGSARPVGGANGTPPGTPPASASAPPAGEPEAGWAAAYRTVGTSADGFSGELTVTNTGSSPSSGWMVSVTLPEGGRLDSAKKASATQSGTTITFTAKNAGKVGPGSSVTIRFEVTGATGPTGCRIEGRGCTGVSG